eukprot:TRINITY_DN7667_c0_g2_i1.p1 TRINITY_DN7667_c0_g2~~TRINITY_DN7667_c0_g2_i1.p1  ORF type:complete len:225 (+),score=50.11 TRINITY_DN7667_c0_g2_i1:128-802(+)
MQAALRRALLHPGKCTWTISSLLQRKDHSSFNRYFGNERAEFFSSITCERLRLRRYNVPRISDGLNGRRRISELLPRKSLTGLTEKHNFSSQSDSEELTQESENQETISVTFIDKDGEEKTVKVPVGMSMLEAAHQNDIDLEGACEGSLACSTCHVIVMDPSYYNKIPEPTDEENDMLDLAFGLTETSRLGCQVIAKPELDGMRLALPAATRNFAVDGYAAKPH